MSYLDEAIELLDWMGISDKTDLMEQFDERAGICEYDGQMTREQAEKIAYEELDRSVSDG